MFQSLVCLAFPVLLGSVTIVSSQETGVEPPTNTRIYWRDVTGDSFIVRWKTAAKAVSYNLFLYKDYTNIIIGNRTNVTGDHYKFQGLYKGVVYGVRVQSVTADGMMSVLSIPARTRTFGRTTTTTTPAPTAPTPVGACGPGFFTCETNQTECIDQTWWCDENKDCTDGSDEKNCPGSCPEITSFHQHGNFSCHRWNSPWSACFFQCNGDYIRVGYHYTVCLHGKWTIELPTCRLRRPTQVRTLKDAAKDTEVTVEFQEISSAVNYAVAGMVTVEEGKHVDAKMSWEKRNATVVATLSGLQPGKRYKGSIAAVDEEGVTGLASRPFISATVPVADDNKSKR